MDTSKFVAFLKEKYNIDVSKEFSEFKKAQKAKTENVIEIYSDGAVPNNANSRKNDIPGGIGVWCDQLDISVSKRFENATNNKMELSAILCALNLVEERKLKQSVIIYTDSIYSIKSCTLWFKKWEENGWKTSTGKDVENQDLIKPVIAKLKILGNVSLKYVKGHSGVEGNEKADELARKAIQMD